MHPLLPLLALPLALSAPEDPAHWPQWRGPRLDGSSEATGLPTSWSAEENVVWKAPLPSWSGATPVVWGERVFVLSPSALSAEEQAEAEREREQDGGGRGRGRGRGRRGSGRAPGGQRLELHCLSTVDGSTLWSAEVGQGNRLYRKGNDASPSPVTDGEHVWTLSGGGRLSAFDMQGERVWSRELQEEYGSFGLNWGYASSPLLHADLLIVEVLHGTHTDEPSYLLALDAASGEVRWRVERPTDALRESPDAYTTPLLVERAEETQIVVSGGDYVTGHALDTGEELWRIAGLNPRAASNYRIVASPVLVGDILIAPTRVRPMLAIDLGEDGRPDAEDVRWRWDQQGGTDVPTPASDGERLYLVSDGGIATCLDASSGEAIWGPVRTSVGSVSSSPLLADGKLYITSEEGVTAVLRAGDEHEELAVNELDGSYTLSSPIAVGGRLYLRTEQFLYCLGAAAERPARRDF